MAWHCQRCPHGWVPPYVGRHGKVLHIQCHALAAMRPHIEDWAGEGMQVLKFGNDEFSNQIDMTNSDKPLENGRWKDNLTEVTEVSLLVSVGITQDLQPLQAVSFTKKDSWFDEAVSLVKVRFQLSLLHFFFGVTLWKASPQQTGHHQKQPFSSEGIQLESQCCWWFSLLSCMIPTLEVQVGFIPLYII